MLACLERKNLGEAQESVLASGTVRDSGCGARYSEGEHSWGWGQSKRSECPFDLLFVW